MNISGLPLLLVAVAIVLPQRHSEWSAWMLSVATLIAGASFL